MNKSLKYIAYSLAALTSLFAVILQLTTFELTFPINKDLIIVVGLGVSLFILMASMLINIISKPTILNIAMLGYPQSGKTVFLTILFNEFVSGNASDNRISFYLRGKETIEKIKNNISLLESQQWLPKTKVENPIFFHRALAIFQGAIKRSYVIEIGDYAGENSQFIDKDNRRWLHKNEYFSYVLQADVIWINIDCAKLFNKEDAISLENELIAAVQVLMDEKGIDYKKGMNTPIALLYMKYDLIKNSNRRNEFHRLEKLLNFLKQNCKNAMEFEISSVGEITREGLPPAKLKPFNVAEPLLWSMYKIKKTTANKSYM